MLMMNKPQPPDSKHSLPMDQETMYTCARACMTGILFPASVFLHPGLHRIQESTRTFNNTNYRSTFLIPSNTVQGDLGSPSVFWLYRYVAECLCLAFKSRSIKITRSGNGIPIYLYRNSCIFFKNF